MSLEGRFPVELSVKFSDFRRSSGMHIRERNPQIYSIRSSRSFESKLSLTNTLCLTTEITSVNPRKDVLDHHFVLLLLESPWHISKFIEY